MTSLLLLRHGQSTWNALGRWQGRADPPLSVEGELAAMAAAEVLAEGTADESLDAEHAAISVAVTSDQTRARQTAVILASRLGLATPAAFTGLRERDVGAFTGLTRAEIERRWPGLLDGPGPLEPPGAEPRAAVLARALTTIRHIASLHPGKRIVTVTHGALIRAVESHLGIHEPGPHPNLGGRWLTVTDGELIVGSRVHLLATARPEPA